MNALPSAQRWYYRCHDCLEVAAHEGRLPEGPRCSCGGYLEEMGPVEPDGHIRLQYRDAVCDFRCTGARGPLCSCRCGAENHGTHRLKTVIIDQGVPVLRGGNADAAVRFRAMRDRVVSAIESRWPELEAKRRGNWIEEWGRYLDGRDALRALARAAGLKTHGGRTKALEALERRIREES